ncbi:MAG: RDD family protein [Acidimicrobiales bacterium]|jgi:uncharacterized RDD family membrane protein YckC|nr:RDD family protein [Acidimicrobiales bacterium]
MTAPARLPGPEDFPASGPNSLASIGQRGIARVLDELLLFVPFTIASLSFLTLEDGQLEGEVPVWFLAVQVAVGVLYEVVLLALWGRTLGKHVLGVRVARFTDGERPRWTQALLRVLLVTAAVVAVDAVLPGLGALAAVGIYLTALRDPMRRGWHDHAGGTVVVRFR